MDFFETMMSKFRNYSKQPNDKGKHFFFALDSMLLEFQVIHKTNNQMLECHMQIYTNHEWWSFVKKPNKRKKKLDESLDLISIEMHAKKSRKLN
jgi:hypothetical protein